MTYKNYVGNPAHYSLMRDWQLSFLTSLPEYNPEKYFLDIGCGSMRLGAVLIPLLSFEKYIGLDRNQEMVQQGIINECQHIDFSQLKPQFIYTDCFDMSSVSHPIHTAWAQAVFNHLNLSTIKVCLTSLQKHLDSEGAFYSTYWPLATEESDDNVDDTYGFKKRNIGHTTKNMKATYTDCGFSFEHVDKTPLGQTVVKSVLL